MKKLSAIIVFLICTFNIQIQAQDISVVANIWPPYVDNALADNGLAMNIVKEAFARSGYKMNLTIEKWEKALQGSEMGAYEVVGAIWKNKLRQEKLLYSQPYMKNNIVLMTSTNNQLEYHSLNDLHGLLVGILKDYAYDEKFMADAKILKFQASRLTQNLIALQKGQLDVVVADKRLALYELKTFMGSNRSKFRFLPKPLASRHLYIAVPKENKQSKTIIEKFNQGLAAIKKDGTYQKIIESYTF
ncbi:MAG: transporter substrate-binding domain-containing protein [gamma proteobacterium symbiont of Taylorina sp.]|nr:transporter substrate-binding domain-containing protein [gamma proteobacterium symbiont of Taylorina sp.]